MTVLFTGHNGFLGRELLPYLSTKYNVITYDGDLCDSNILSNFVAKNSVSRIIHSAAKVATRLKQDTVSNLVENLQMTLNLAQLEIPMLSFCSGKIFGYQESIRNASERDVASRYPNDFYGQSKFIINRLLASNQNVNFLRFFNVFGASESKEKFIRSNITRYINKEPMIIHQPMIYDFFYVEDTLPLIDLYMNNKIPKDLNLVYSEKFSLMQVCKQINQLGSYEMDIIIEDESPGKDYFGDGTKLNEMDIPLKGFSYGLESVYRNLILRKE